MTTNIADNLAAFLTMIGHSEGTIQIPGGDNGYREFLKRPEYRLQSGVVTAST